MKHLTMLFLAGALFAGYSAELDAQKKTAPAKAEVKTSQVPALIKKINDNTNRKNLKAVQEACDELMKQADATPDQKCHAYIQLGKTIYAQKKPDAAAAEAAFDKAISLPGVSDTAKIPVYYIRAERAFRSNFPGGGIVYTEAGIIKALELYREVAAFKGMGNAQKIEVQRRIANCLLELMMVEEAFAELQKAVALPNLTWEEMYNAKINLANVYRRALEYDKADKLYREVLESSDKEKLHIHKLTFLYNIIAGRISATKGEAAAREWLKSQPRSADLLSKRIWGAREYDSFIQAHEATLKETEGKNITRRHNDAIMGLLSIAYNTGNGAMVQDTVKNKTAFLFKADPGAKARIARKLRDYSIGRYRLMDNLPLKHLSLTLALELEPDNISALNELLRTERAMGKYQESLKTMDTILKLEKATAAQKLDFAISKEAINGKDGKAVAAKVKSIVMSNPDEKQRNDKVLANALLSAARTALAMNKHEMARTIWDIRSELLLNRPKPTLDVTFIKDAPQDISEFLNHPYIKDPKNLGVLDFKYGDNLEFLLLTDSAITGRSITETAGTGPTKFAAICDHKSVKLFFIMPCAPERAALLKQGYGSFGGFEMYLATGFDQAYHCLLVDGPPSGTVWDSFNTQYNNKGYRVLKDSNSYRSSFKITEDCVYLLLELDWSIVFNGIPEDGTIWEFEPIHWENRGKSWGGSVSVHNRSTFGHLIFRNMTPENRTAIKRTLLPKAKAAWNKELSSRTGGIIEHWQDPDLGDVKFHQEKIAPFWKKYGAYAAAIKPGMSDEEVNRVFDEAYYVLINAKFYVQQMRVEYLDRVLTEEE